MGSPSIHCENSRPSDWFTALLPLKRGPSDPLTVVTLNDWATYTNAKAAKANAGQPGGMYPDWTPFSPVEIKQFIGLYIFNGISPSPQISMKFKPHHEDYVHGNDPNWKIDPFIAHIMVVSMWAWVLGRNISCDEQTIGFKGNHADKRRITYKKEGDGFQADTICEKGFTYSIYFRNMPPPAHYIVKKCSALHARVLFLFEELKDKYHVCGLDNLYNSVKFCRDAWEGKNKVMVHGVAWKTGRGVPECCQQEEFSCPKKQEEV